MKKRLIISQNISQKQTYSINTTNLLYYVAQGSEKDMNKHLMHNKINTKKERQKKLIKTKPDTKPHYLYIIEIRYITKKNEKNSGSRN